MTIGMVVVARLAARAGAWRRRSSVLLDEVGGHLRQELGLALRPAILEDDVLPFHVTQLSETIGKRHDDM
jgi:hypothetical protein